MGAVETLVSYPTFLIAMEGGCMFWVGPELTMDSENHGRSWRICQHSAGSVRFGSVSSWPGPVLPVRFRYTGPVLAGS